MGNWVGCSEHIHDEDRRNAKSAFDKGGIDGLIMYLTYAVSEWKRTPVNIGVIGEFGRGKSTFINAVRGLTGDDKGAATVGTLETTTKATPYKHPENPLLRFWDLPGIGTEGWENDKYLKSIDFDQYDCFLVLTATRFTELDTWLGSKALETGQKVYFIRTKFHNDVNNDKEAHPRTHNPQALLEQIRKDMRDQLKFMKSDAPMFVIDSHRRNLYDFNSLLNFIATELPSIQKGAATALTLSGSSQSLVRKKIGVLRFGVWKAALLAVLTSEDVDSAESGRGEPRYLNFQAIHNEVKEYYKIMGLDDESLIRAAASAERNIDVADLRAAANRFFPQTWFASLNELSNALNRNWISLKTQTARMAANHAKKLPLNKWRIHDTKYYGIHVAALYWALEKIERAALAVVSSTNDGSWEIIYPIVPFHIVK